MDDRQAALEEKLARLLDEAAQVEVELSRVTGAVGATSHYSVIESRAHELGRRLSRKAQQRQMGEAASQAAPRAPCPVCETLCSVSGSKRQVTSVDGEVTLQELKAHCPSCRRDFFPSADDLGPGCP